MKKVVAWKNDSLKLDLHELEGTQKSEPKKDVKTGKKVFIVRKSVLGKDENKDNKHFKNILQLQKLLKEGSLENCSLKELDIDRINEDREEFIHSLKNHKLRTQSQGKVI